MLIAATSILQIIGTVAAVVFGLAAFMGLVAGSVYIVKSRKIQTNNQLADSAVQSLTAANQGLESRLTLVERDNEHCMELKLAQDLQIAQLSGSVNELRSWVTARDLITDLSNMTRAGLIALHVDPKVLEVVPADHPRMQ